MHKKRTTTFCVRLETLQAPVCEEIVGRPPRSLLCSASAKPLAPWVRGEVAAFSAVRATAFCIFGGLGVVPLLFYRSRFSGVQALPVHGCGGGMRFRRCGSGWRLLRVGAPSLSRPSFPSGLRPQRPAKGVWARVAGWRLPGGQPRGPAFDPPLRRHSFLYTYVFTPFLRCETLGRTSSDRVQDLLRAFLIGPAQTRNSRPGVAGVLPLPRLRARGAPASKGQGRRGTRQPPILTA